MDRRQLSEWALIMQCKKDNTTRFLFFGSHIYLQQARNLYYNRRDATFFNATLISFKSHEIRTKATGHLSCQTHNYLFVLHLHHCLNAKVSHKAGMHTLCINDPTGTNSTRTIKIVLMSTVSLIDIFVNEIQIYDVYSCSSCFLLIFNTPPDRYIKLVLVL